MKTNALTQKIYWDYNWKNIKLPQFIDIKHSTKSIKDLNKIFKKYLNVDNNINIIEIGCAPGTWLNYFHKNFQYKISGIEFTAKGFQNTVKNLKILGTPGKIINDDFLKHKFTQKYDIVFSMGFVEHFTFPDLVIKKHFDILKKNGYLIIEIPNLRYVNYFIGNLVFDKKIIDSHNQLIMSLGYFERVVVQNKSKKIFLDYVGSFNPFLFPIKQTALTTIVSIIIEKICGLFFIKSKYFSPYILLIAQK